MRQTHKISFIQWVLIIGVFLLFLKLEMGIWNLWNSDILYLNAQNYQKVNRYVDAYQSLKKAIEQLPSEPVFVDEMSQLTANLALAAKDNDATLSSQLAQMALIYSNQAIASSPQNVAFYKTRARVLYSISLLDKKYLPIALETIKTAADLAPTDAKINYFYGLISSLNGKIDEAITILEKTVAIKPDYRDAHFELAKLYLDKKQTDLAKSHAEFILKKIGDDQEVKEWAKENL